MQLDEDRSKAQFVSLVLDKSSDITGCARLCIFIQYVFESLIMKKELLQLVLLPKTTTGQDISHVLFKNLQKHNVPYRLQNLQKHNVDKISSIATDGTPSMIGKTKE